MFGDPHRLQQIVWNLLTNAVKFTPRGGKVDVIVQRVNSHLEIIVHDTGMGAASGPLCEWPTGCRWRGSGSSSSTTRRTRASWCSAEEALALLKAQRMDVIISDIGMPGRDGYQFIRDVRTLATADGGKTPAVALTAFARSEDRTRAMLAGYQVHVSKPIDPQELVATIKSLAGNNS